MCSESEAYGDRLMTAAELAAATERILLAEARETACRETRARIAAFEQERAVAWDEKLQQEMVDLRAHLAAAASHTIVPGSEVCMWCGTQLAVLLKAAPGTLRHCTPTNKSVLV